ncbi:hypothetical protein PIB30_085711 [Stylosanthes scabra]|uniref:Uncharacterized protein n=1 Tax=Stylosanthes scabra TaxID=79078 RepID=A0ABU6QTG2_9FABA|nr:hypothetical protein [Stylosanthes scabra]
MEDRKADRKRKGKAVSSSSQVVPRFKTLYHEAHFNSTLSARRVLLELIIQVDESILDPCGFQIQQRKWEKFTKPIQAVGHLMVKEFYANAWELDKAKRKPYTYTSMVRGDAANLFHDSQQSDKCIGLSSNPLEWVIVPNEERGLTNTFLLILQLDQNQLTRNSITNKLEN